jgi:hypothetical protein
MRDRSSSRYSVFAALLLLPCLPQAGPARADEAPPAVEYRTHAEVTARLEAAKVTAWGRGLFAEVVTYGTSAGGRSLLALRLGRATPVVLVHGGLGARDAAATATCLAFAEHLAAGGARVEDLAWLVVPAPNPDALDAFLAGRPPAGGGAFDRDRDGRRGEDGPQDVDGDGEILWMRRVDARGTWAAAATTRDAEGRATGDARLLERRGVDARRAVSYVRLPEGLDDDGDGDVAEDMPALDLTRQLAGWRDDKGPWRGDGPFPGYAPEARALMELSFAQTGLVAWYGFTGTGTHVLRANEEGKLADVDDALYAQIGRGLEGRTGLKLRKASQVPGREANPGSDLDWAAVHLGVPAFRIPVWWIRKEAGSGRKRDAPDELDWLLWNDRALGGRGFSPWKAFEHPTLGPVEIGGWRRFTRWEPPAALLPAAAARVLAAPLAQVGFAPRLGADVRVEARGAGRWMVAVRATNTGRLATDSALAAKQRLDVGVRVRFEAGPGVEVLAGPPVGNAGRLAAGAVAAEPVRWLVAGPAAGALGTVRVEHPKADDVRTEVTTP